MTFFGTVLREAGGARVWSLGGKERLRHVAYLNCFCKLQTIAGYNVCRPFVIWRKIYLLLLPFVCAFKICPFLVAKGEALGRKMDPQMGKVARFFLPSVSGSASVSQRPGLFCNATFVDIFIRGKCWVFVIACHTTWFPRSGNWLWSLTLQIRLACWLILVQEMMSRAVLLEAPPCFDLALVDHNDTGRTTVWRWIETAGGKSSSTKGWYWQTEVMLGVGNRTSLVF